MLVTRKLYNQYNKIFQVEFEDGTIMTGKYDLKLLNRPEDMFRAMLDVYFDDYDKESFGTHKIIAKEAIIEQIYNDINKIVEKNFFFVLLD